MTATPITIDTVAAGELLMGVAYSRAERELMLDNLAGQIAPAPARRRCRSPTPAAGDPVRPAACRLRHARAIRRSNIPRDGARRCRTPTPPSLLRRAASVGVDRGRAAQLGAADPHLSRAHPAPARPRCSASQPSPMTWRCAQADAADALLAAGTWLGPLHGIPYGAKGHPRHRRHHHRLGRGAVSRPRAGSATRPSCAGCAPPARCCSARPRVGALAYGDIWYGGRTRNPWNTEEGSSGSSAGSASPPRPGWSDSRSAPRRWARSSRPAPAAAPPGCARPSAACRAPARWRCAGRSTRSGRSAARWTTRRWCWRRSTGSTRPTRADRSAVRLRRRGRSRMRVGYLAADFSDPHRPRPGAGRRARARRRGRRAPLPDLPYDALIAT